MVVFRDIYNDRPWYLYPKHSNAMNLTFLIQEWTCTASWIIGSFIPWILTGEESFLQLLTAIVGWLICMVLIQQLQYFIERKKHLKRFGKDWQLIANHGFDEYGRNYYWNVPKHEPAHF